MATDDDPRDSEPDEGDDGERDDDPDDPDTGNPEDEEIGDGLSER